MAGPGRTQTLPPKADSKPARHSALEDGRIRLCDGLLVSVNRSWQVESGGPERPVAAFKAMARLAFWAPGETGAGDIYVAAIAPHDAYWLGFEARSGSYGVSPEINGANPLADTMEGSGPGFLLVPDQPWFDAVRDTSGNFRQLIPDFKGSGENPIGGVISLKAFIIPDDAIADQPDQDPDDVQPLYGQDTPVGSAPEKHPWPQRPLRPGFARPDACGHITVFLLQPADFQNLTGISLDAEDYSAEGAPPQPFDPFQ